jgi:hypothetical protein
VAYGRVKPTYNVDSFFARPKEIRLAVAKFFDTEGHRTDRHEDASSRSPLLFELAY